MLRTLLIAALLSRVAAAADPAGAELFEKSIRPLLAKHCLSCHSTATKKSKGGLTLDTRAAMLQGGDNGPALVPGKPAESLLLKAIRHEGPRMPPKIKLPDSVAAEFAKWIALGADISAAGDGPTKPEKAKSHWAFQPIRRPEPPAVKRAGWVRNPVDAFILAKLESAGLSPAAEADAAALLRRASFDLTGLPPTPEEIESFVVEYRAKPQAAWAALVERLLASPHYGERWGRHWLDVVRYADSAGYEIDNFYEYAFQYRDYVVRSLNADKPFDRFVHEQIAGDELWPDSDEARIGTGFATVGPYAFEGGIARPEVVEYQRVTDLADTAGSAFLGLTIGCARCHDHKFDPVSQQDYFGIQAVFAASKAVPLGKDKNPGHVMQVLGARPKAPVTHVLKRGELDTPGDPVPPSTLRSLPGGGVIEEKRPDAHKRRRSEFAKWLTTPDNPLTARVIASRAWQWHFGNGLVGTPNDFGLQGESPTHPELLDWLATELTSHGWSLKHLHRVILNSAAYRMGGSPNAETAKRDPECRLVSRFPRRRLEAEAIWDAMHAAAGTLDPALFGPAVYPPIDKDILGTKFNVQWDSDKHKAGWNRRGLYMVVRRSLTHPFFDAFNVGQPTTSCARRDTTVVAPQALELLNGRLAVDQARAFAGRLMRDCGDDPKALVSRAWLLAFGRPARDDERRAAIDFLITAEKAASGRKPHLSPTGAPTNQPLSPARAAALVEFCLGLINANEFLFVD